MAPLHDLEWIPGLSPVNELLAYQDVSPALAKAGDRYRGIVQEYIVRHESHGKWTLANLYRIQEKTYINDLDRLRKFCSRF